VLKLHACDATGNWRGQSERSLDKLHKLSSEAHKQNRHELGLERLTVTPNPYPTPNTTPTPYPYPYPLPQPYPQP